MVKHLGTRVLVGGLGALLAGMVILAYAIRSTPAQAQAIETARPKAIHSFGDVMDQTSCIFRGTVSAVTYEEVDGDPWTVTTFKDAQTLRGPEFAEYSIRQYGGWMSDGSFVGISHQAELVLGEQYIIFLRNTRWALSPVVGELALRVVQDESEVLVDNDGGVVTGFSPAGLEMSDAIYESPGLDGKRPERLPDRAMPASTLDVDGLLANVDWFMKLSRKAIQGRPLSEPDATLGFGQTAPPGAAAAPPGRTAEETEAEPSTVDETWKPHRR